MSFTVITAGLQASIQGAPYRTMRGSAIPACGAADPLSLALANRLLGKPSGALAIEITATACAFRTDMSMHIALTGAAQRLYINDRSVSPHASHAVHGGDTIIISAPDTGVRSYLALSHDIDVPRPFENGSTCFSGGFGGLDGRALENGDVLSLRTGQFSVPDNVTPPGLRPVFTGGFLLRYVEGAEHGYLDADSAAWLSSQQWRASPRMNRMGIALDGPVLSLADKKNLPSGAVFPGTIQCPPSGQPFLLGVDGQTSGGYPCIAQIIRADRHLIGQIRPGDTLKLVRKRPLQAQQIYRQKMDFWRQYLPDFRLD
ncbi:biotin-dependent carboxyltransferase family protein [Sphingorhabdus sp. Alg239-R122]|uniref:5-oxoprolinase subunit C family protein n=1 Tax=Sphingorhabdus sp. Alg239-R122 TaxID=2305989 RepID=UPI0013DB28F9|nr:biotin-dependent carboxyltransferase family protein [Sphingorhabdus sp. Alg239-R122]